MNSKSQQVIATLRIQTPGQAERIYSLRDGQSVNIGRDENNEITLDDPSVSRVHATFSASTTGLVLGDMSSLNGTFVNGQRITSMRDISSSDVIDIGATKIKVEVAADETTRNRGAGSSKRAMTAQLQPISVTVMITTVCNYKQLSQEVPTAQVVETHLKWAQRATQLVDKYGGRVDKVIGPTIVAIWTGPQAGELAQRATRAAIELRQVNEDIVAGGEWPHQETHPWQVRIVLSSGHGLKGVVGAGASGQARDFTILGDPTNTAFRVEEIVATTGETFVIADSTANLIQGKVPLKKLAKVALPGGDEQIELYTSPH